jgi:hypothetical protein
LKAAGLISPAYGHFPVIPAQAAIQLNKNVFSSMILKQLYCKVLDSRQRGNDGVYL